MKQNSDSIIYDIAIIGLGPSGATLARLLSSKLKVVAIDKGNGTPQGFIKPCGGLLAPDAQKILAQLNLTLPKNILVDPQLFSVRTIDTRLKIIRHYQRFYINLDRLKFDNWLRSLISPSVDIFNESLCESIEKIESGFKLTIISNNQKSIIFAKQIVGADGANSIVRRTFFPKHKIKKYLAIQEWFTDTHAVPFYSCIFDTETTDTYAWGLSKENHFVFGGAFEIKNARKDFELLKEKMITLGFELNNPTKTEACLLLKPMGLKNFCCGEDGVFLVGESAGFISPSSFEGISYALESASLLANVFNSSTKKPLKAYKKSTRKLRKKLIIKSLKSRIIYSAFLRKVILKSGIRNISTEKIQKYK
ncbi:MAG: FAD-binding protein [Firmicutes bacterium]|nr:FAD-binding protein [Bacillota bacterium]